MRLDRERLIRKLSQYFVLAAVLVGTPLLCAWLAGRVDLFEGLAAFPPRTEDWGGDPSMLWNMRKPFSWPVFIGMAAGIAAVVLPFIRRLLGPADAAPRQAGTVAPGGRMRSQTGKKDGRGGGAKAAFPWYGWLGLALGAAAWVLAWSRFAWVAPLQAHTFLPLWLAYILVMNALCVRRTGRCLMTSHPGPYAALFPVSAAFWWFFEYLNRYVWNWYYRGVEGMCAEEYVFFATCSFATVLPAVTATAEWLASFRPFSDNRLCGFVRMDVRHPMSVAAMSVAAAGGLCGIVFFPQFTFPLLWVSPLAVFLVLQEIGRASCRERV